MQRSSRYTIGLAAAAVAATSTLLGASAAVAKGSPGDDGRQTPSVQSVPGRAKAAIEHEESLRQPATQPTGGPSKAAIEHQESLQQPATQPTGGPSKAAIEHQESVLLAMDAALPSQADAKHWLAVPPPQEVRDATAGATTVASSDDGFDWTAASQGAAATGLGLVLVGGVVLIVRQMRRPGSLRTS